MSWAISRTCIIDSAAGNARRGDSERALRAQHRIGRAAEDVEIEPRRPVADIERVVKFLIPQIAVAARRCLPQARDAGCDMGSQRLEARGELLEVVGGERSRSDQAHI